MVGKEPGDLLRVIERRQKQLREFPYNVVHDAHAWSKLQIGNPRGVSVVRDRIQSLPLQIKVHGVERVVEIEPWALAHVVKHDAACMERIAQEARENPEVLREAPPASAATANALWRHVATPARLRLELSVPCLDFSTIESPSPEPGLVSSRRRPRVEKSSPSASYST